MPTSLERYLLIDQIGAIETRVAITEDGVLQEFDSELSIKKSKKGNVYVAKIARIEPSLQAVFIDYGEERHGFLPFSEIHPMFYGAAAPPAKTEEPLPEISADNGKEDEDDDLPPMASAIASVSKSAQNILKKGQTLIVQVTKDFRGTKGMSFTTYISIAGRYSILMPNGPAGKGISKKISDGETRKNLRELVDSLEIDASMGFIIRTASMGKKKAEIKKDYEYLLRLWTDISAKAKSTSNPSVVHEEYDLVSRAIRDMYDSDVSKIIVENQLAYKKAREFMKMMLPSHVKKIELYSGDNKSLFDSYGIEAQLDDINKPMVILPSGGAIVIAQTEALIAVDVNSAKATKAKNFELTAVKTNMEAATEIARQIRLRSLSGLIVIDFIDMASSKSKIQVEDALKKSTKSDRANISLGKISSFGLLEMSRQQTKQSILEKNYIICEHCDGVGRHKSEVSSAIFVLRAVLKWLRENDASERVNVHCHTFMISQILNFYKKSIIEMEETFNTIIIFHPSDCAGIKIENEKSDKKYQKPKQDKREKDACKTITKEEPVVPIPVEGEEKKSKKRRRRKKSVKTEPNIVIETQAQEEQSSQVAATEQTETDQSSTEQVPQKKRRRRYRKARKPLQEAGADPESQEQKVVG